MKRTEDNGFLTEITDEESAIMNGGNYAYNQVRGLISGIIRNGGRNSALGALAGRSIVYTTGLQSYPQSRLVFYNGRYWWV
jgi:hypothetical protein